MMKQMVVLISANIEWDAVRQIISDVEIMTSPYGKWFYYPIQFRGEDHKIVLFHGGWGKISAAASTQFVIDHFSPAALINLGTCGGFHGYIQRGEIVLVEKTIVYDIIEQMGDFDSHIAHYTTDIDLSWLVKDYPIAVKRGLIVSGDRDLLTDDIVRLHQRYGAFAGDWESGAIAFVAAHNAVPLLILRGVTDLVGSEGGEAYGNLEFFQAGALVIMKKLISLLPQWIDLVAKSLDLLST